MTGGPLARVTTLAFDIFGTVLDLTGSITPPTRQFLEDKGARISADAFWDQWRARQRIEQYQDSLMMLGHSGYLETCRRALLYCLRLNAIAFTDAEVRVKERVGRVHVVGRKDLHALLDRLPVWMSDRLSAAIVDGL